MRPRPPRYVRAAGFVAAVLLGHSDCATLNQLGLGLKPLRFEAARDRPAELRLGGGILGGRGGLPDAARLRLWAHVENPNTFGLTLAAIEGAVYLEDTHAASVDFPLGLPLEPGLGQDIPLDVSLSLRDLPDLAGVLSRALGGQALGYRLDGRFTVDAGALGTPSFGPATLLRGEVRPLR
jgi:hypothetical protein